MNRRRAAQFCRGAYTIVEMLIAGGVTGMIMTALISGSIAMMRSFSAVSDYATDEGNQQRISDYLAVDMRRSTGIVIDGSGVVTMTLPNYYQANGTPNSPTVTNTLGWPTTKKKQKKHKHRNIIIDQTASYDPANTYTVKYYKGAAGQVGQNSSIFYREVGGVAKAIATDVADFNLTVSDDKSWAKTQITFTPTFHLRGSATNATTATTLSQTTLLRNFQN